MSDLLAHVASLWRFPVKSCAGRREDRVELTRHGLAQDRSWMVVDAQGRMLTQRQHPRMALIGAEPTARGLRLSAPGAPALDVDEPAGDTRLEVSVWGDELVALAGGDQADAWLSQWLGQPARLVRFGPDQTRRSDPEWTAGVEATTMFSDGFALLVCSSASLAELNRRLALKGGHPVGIERFRPNLVLDGLDAFDEDHLEELRIDTAGGEVRLRLVKPCVRCAIPNVDPRTGKPGGEPGATLASFRADARMGGGITFGMNAIVLDGAGAMLEPGQPVRANYAF